MELVLSPCKKRLSIFTLFRALISAMPVTHTRLMGFESAVRWQYVDSCVGSLVPVGGMPVLVDGK
jgi:hypothetical protein